MKSGKNKLNIIKWANPKAMLSLALVAGLSLNAMAEEVAPVAAAEPTVYSNPLFIGLLVAILFLLVVIIVMADVVKTSAYHRVEVEKAKKDKDNSSLKAIVAFILLGGFSFTASAEEVATKAVSSTWDNYMGLDAVTFYFMVIAILFELYVIWNLYGIINDLLGVKERDEEMAKSGIVKRTIFDQLNDSVAIEKEADILLDHNYDGIKELDNSLPPWWVGGFFVTIAFSVVYLFYYHISRNGKLSDGEYKEEMAQATSAIQAYKKLAPDLIDEEKLVALTDAASLDGGKAIYMENCQACHGNQGQGGMGPNLTDAYWLHKGGIKDVYRSIKLGWPEKGMKAWEQDLGAKKIHQVASYILSLKGSNPPGAKEPQGDLYSGEEVVPGDSTAVKADSVSAAAPAATK
ncbi:MAG: c-type cytochrome [Bacteroidia bacterium]|nr:c-type cytochrome [Bacteroidia bacterium]